MKTVYEIMERVESKDPGKIMMLIQDGFREITAGKRREAKSKMYDIVSGVGKYPLPDDMVGLEYISVLDESNTVELLETADQEITTGHNWTNTDFDTFDYSGETLAIINDAANQSAYLDDDDIITKGKWYRLGFDCDLTGGTFQFQTYTDSLLLGAVSDGENVLEFRSPATDKLKLVGTAVAGTAEFDNFSLKEIMIDKYRKIPVLVGDLGYDWTDKTQYYLNRSQDV